MNIKNEELCFCNFFHENNNKEIRKTVDRSTYVTFHVRNVSNLERAEFDSFQIIL